ncbi:hypothetical protein [Alkalicoccus urumqiensis]|uniref:Uncharacterized protein n=1 Tax=Alkalicoccus urumqiensis TaxID=1548213 RepID=A0A2P6MH58_ALKUR|nr:hypothetical protein [Alkalicoccus urumqiensis]PRO65619.1 hypothetical protein C6I21_08840 [Alkalicoccus urumqiensis]
MSERELIQTILRRIAKLEHAVATQEGLEDISDQMDEQSDAIRHLHMTLAELKGDMQMQHMENVNSDDLLMRSFLHHSLDK